MHMTAEVHLQEVRRMTTIDARRQLVEEEIATMMMKIRLHETGAETTQMSSTALSLFRSSGQRATVSPGGRNLVVMTTTTTTPTMAMIAGVRHRVRNRSQDDAYDRRRRRDDYDDRDNDRDRRSHRGDRDRDDRRRDRSRRRYDDDDSDYDDRRDRGDRRDRDRKRGSSKPPRKMEIGGFDVGPLVDKGQRHYGTLAPIVAPLVMNMARKYMSDRKK